LRIALVAPIAAPIVPSSTRSIEQLIYLQTEELVRRGHEVTLFATGDSRTSAALQAVYARSYEEDDDLGNWEFHEIINAEWAMRQAVRFDVIHSHAYHYALPFVRLVATPVLHTYHILPDDDIVPAYARLGARVAAISEYQRRAFRGVKNVAVVHHGIDTDAFPFSAARGEYLLFLGRILPEKGADLAIRLARRVGMRLILAGTNDENDDFFRSEIAPAIDDQKVRYVGPVAPAERNRLLAGAAALVYPIVEPEPFGLVLIEAMACGTPVLALAIGAVPEIVEDGVTGYRAPSVERLAELLPDVLRLDRARVRREAVRRFDYRRMVDHYEGLYRRLAGAG
jgi:glycosyltransferase involved in cell wall biosynthesis